MNYLTEQGARSRTLRFASRLREPRLASEPDGTALCNLLRSLILASTVAIIVVATR